MIQSRRYCASSGQVTYTPVSYTHLDVYKRQLYDRSDGFYRRQLILTTKDKPQSRVDDPDIAEKMAAEVKMCIRDRAATIPTLIF